MTSLLLLTRTILSSFLSFFLEKDKRRITCPGCKHAVLNVMKPISCRLHEYTGTLTHSVSRLSDRVDYYFYYDLMRMALPSLTNAISEGKILQVQAAKYCDRFKDSHSSSTDRDANSNDSSPRSTDLDDESASNVVTDTQTSSQINSDPNNNQERGRVDGNGRGGFDVHKQLFDPSLDYHGRYGEFVIYSKDGGSKEGIIDQVSRSSYQDIGMRIFKVIYLKNRRRVKKHATWFYGEPEGIIVSRAYQEEDPEEKPAADVKPETADEQNKGEPAEPAEPAAEGASESSPAEGGSEGGNSEGGNSEGGDDDDAEGDGKKAPKFHPFLNCPGSEDEDENTGKKTSEILTFLVDHVRIIIYSSDTFVSFLFLGLIQSLKLFLFTSIHPSFSFGTEI